MQLTSCGRGLLAIAILAADPVAAQPEQTRQITVVQEMAPVGLGLSQTLRYTWGNRAPLEVRDQFEALRVLVRLVADDGTVLAEDAAEAVSVGRFQVFDFSRGSIGRPGEVLTGRLQVRVVATIVGRSKYGDIVLKRGRDAVFDDAVEIIDEGTGATVVGFGRGLNELSMDDTAGKEHAGRAGFQIISAGRDRLIGIVPGQSLRITAADPIGESAAERKFKPLFAFSVLDLDGKTLVEGAQVAIGPDQSHSFDVPYSALGVAPAGRVQVRVEARRYFHGIASRVAQGEADGPVVLEIVDAASGRTVVHLLQKPKEIVVVGSKIDP